MIYGRAWYNPRLMTQFLAVHARNPQKRLISALAGHLREGVVVYPTDSNYALA